MGRRFSWARTGSGPYLVLGVRYVNKSLKNTIGDIGFLRNNRDGRA
jgi:hypothetical protein